MPIREAPYVRRPYTGDGMIRLADLGLQSARMQSNAVRDRGQQSAQAWSRAGSAISQGIGAVREERELLPLRQAAAAKVAREAEMMRRQDEQYTEGRQAKATDDQKLARLKEIFIEFDGQPIPKERLIKEFGLDDAEAIDAKQAKMFPKPEAPKTRQVEINNPDGSKRIEIVEDKPQSFTSAAPIEKPKLHPVTVPGPNGPVTKMFTEEQMQQGVPTYRAPTQGPAPEHPSVWLTKDGQERFVTAGDAAKLVEQGWKKPAGEAKPASGVQKRALNFFNRAQQADVDLEGMETDIQKMGLTGQAWLSTMPNFLQTGLGQRYTQAQRAFTEARLRKDSGAAIPKEEFENDAQTYFVQPGDDLETQAQKRRARATMLASMGFESGQALAEFLGNSDEATTMVQDYRTRAAAPAAGGLSVTTPDGQVFTFPSKAQADAFKKRAGIK